MTHRHEPHEEPFIGSLRDRIDRAKAENARTRASTPVPRDVGPPSEEALRAQAAARARARADDHKHVTGRVSRLVVFVALLLLALWLVYRYGVMPGGFAERFITRTS